MANICFEEQPAKDSAFVRSTASVITNGKTNVAQKFPLGHSEMQRGVLRPKLPLHVLYLINEGRATEGHSHYLHTSNRLERLFIDTSN